MKSMKPWRSVSLQLHGNWNAKCAKPLVNGNHMAEIITDTLRSFQECWNVGEPVAVTDNASNEVKAFKLLNWRWISCMGQNINLVVRKGLGVNEINRLVVKGRSIVSFFHHSPQAIDDLMETTKLPLDEAFQRHKMIADYQTRRNDGSLVRQGPDFKEFLSGCQEDIQASFPKISAFYIFHRLAWYLANALGLNIPHELQCSINLK